MIVLYIIGIVFLLFIVLMVFLGRDPYPAKKNGAGTYIGMGIFLLVVACIICMLVIRIING